MPTYEYLCADCANHWEEIQRISEPALEVCPACHKTTAKRQISGGSFILKGGGWYADAYSSSKPAKSGGEGGEGAKSDSPKAESSGSEGAKASTPAPAKEGGSSGGGGSTSGAGGSSSPAPASGGSGGSSAHAG